MNVYLISCGSTEINLLAKKVKKTTAKKATKTQK